MKTNWFRRTLLSYFPIFFVTVTIIVFLSFLMVNEISRQETAKADDVSTTFIMENLERSVNEVEMNILKEVETNAGYAAFVNRTSDDQKLVYALAPRIRALTDGSDLIDSIYLYRQSDKTVLTERGAAELSAFADRGFVEKALGQPDYRGWSDVRDFQELTADDKTKLRSVISMYKHLPLPFGSQGLLVINVNMYQLKQIVNSMTSGDVSFLIIKDKEGNPIFEAHQAEADGRPPSGSKVLTQLKSDTLGWEFESGIRAGQLYSWVSVISYVWIAIGVLTVVLAVVYLVYITRRNYRPIQLMMNRIQSIPLNQEPSPAMKDELAMIDNALSSLITRSDDYEKQYRENMLLQRSQLFMDLLGGHPIDRELAERIRRLNPLPAPSEVGGYAIILAEINDYAGFQGFYSAKDQNVLKFAIMNVFQELARNEKLDSWAEWIDGSRVAALIGLPRGENGKTPEDLRRISDHCRSWVEDKLRISLSFGIGPAIEGLEDMRSSFESASEALEHKLSLGQGTILFGEQMSAGTLSNVLPYLSTISDMAKSFRQNNEEWRDRLREMFASFRGNVMKDDDIRSLLQTLLQMLHTELGSFSDELNALLSGEEATQWQRILDDTRTLEQLETRIGDYLNEVYRTYVVVSKTNSHRAMINEMKSYIEEHFSDPDLSLKHLSDRFEISGKYASYLFKMEFDMKFVDFLIQLRMERAEQLLRETKQPIQDIALAIGYANSITFGRVFKRVYGLAPGDYRKLKQRGGAVPAEEA